MAGVLGVVITRFSAAAGSLCLEIRSCMVSLTIFWFEGVSSLQKKELLESCRKVSCWQPLLCKMTTAPPLIVISLRLQRFKSADHSLGLKLENLLPDSINICYLLDSVCCPVIANDILYVD